MVYDPLIQEATGGVALRKDADHVRVFVTGSRTWDQVEFLNEAFRQLDRELGPDTVKILVSGNCPQGADLQAEQVCLQLGWRLELHPADWGRHGKAAGFIRNKTMAESNPTLLMAFMQDKSRGAGHSVRLAKAAGVPMRIYSRAGAGPVETVIWPEEAPPDTSMQLW